MKKNKHLFSKALFKQSCKANGTMWLIITAAVCFMLACVMLISGTSNISDVTSGVEQSIVQEEIKSQIKKSSVTMYDKVEKSETTFDETFVTTFNSLNTQDNFMTIYALQSSGASSSDLQAKIQEIYITPSYTAAVASVAGLYPGEGETKSLYQASMVTINPNHQVDSTYTDNKETIPSEYIESFSSYIQADIFSWQYVLTLSATSPTTTLSTYIKTNERTEFIEDRTYNALAMIIASQITDASYKQTMLDSLKEYSIDEETYDSFGFDYKGVKTISYEAMMEFQNKYDYEVSLIDTSLSQSEYEAAVKKVYDDLYLSVAGGLLDGLPDAVADGIREIGSMDMYGLIVGSIFFKMAGLLLPIIYIIMASNNLIAGQVDTGSMAYVLSTSTKREEVTFTQGVYLVGSLLLMFICTAITSCICFAIADVETSLTYAKLILINLDAFAVMLAIAGINYCTSCFFDRSKKAMSLGGGLSMFFLVATMLGLFGSHVIPSVIRIEALNNFNYVTIISLFDVVSILDGSHAWIYKFAILVVIGLVGFTAGHIKFKKKDLPL